MKKEIILISLQRLKTFLAQCKELFAAKDHSHSVATEQKDGFMSSGFVKDIEAIIEKLNNFGRLTDFDGGEPDNTDYRLDLDGGEPESIYTLDDSGFVVTLIAKNWKLKESSTKYVQSINDARISGLNDYYVVSTLDSLEPSATADEYNNNFKYLTNGKTTGTTLELYATSAPTIDLSVRICKI